MPRNYEVCVDTSNRHQPSSPFTHYLPSASAIRFFAFAALAGINGALYFAISKSGGDNLQNLFKNHEESLQLSIDVISGMSCLCYALFFYKTLVSLTLKPSNLAQFFLACFAPFSASSFLTGGKNGTQSLNFSSKIALAVGIILFVLRMINCIDGSVKFPKRVEAMKDTWSHAWRKKDLHELIRLIITTLTSIGYSIGSTDAIYAASQIVLSWFGITPHTAKPYSYAWSAAGALGTLPMILYWTHRGLKQLTFGGDPAVTGPAADPTDRYTFLSLFLVLPVVLGILGAETSENNHAFGRLGLFAEIIKVVTAIIYATCAGTPGVSTLVRSFFEKCTLFRKTTSTNSEEKMHLLVNAGNS